jgi:hypothetical protein
MTDFIQIKTPEDVDKIEPVDFDDVTNGFSIRMREDAKHYHLGSLNVSRLIKEINPCYKVLKKIFEDKKIPPLKLFTYGDVMQDRKENNMLTMHGLHHHAMTYNQFLPHGYTSAPTAEQYPVGFNTTVSRTEEDPNGERPINYYGAGEDDKDSHYLNLVDSKTMWDSSYYHAAKAHWLVQSIREEGLWAPIQGIILKDTSFGGEKYKFYVHPGSVRSGVIEEMQDPTMMCHFFDPHNKVPEVEPATVDEFLEYWNQLLKKRGITQDNLSFIITGGVIEVSSEFANVSDFRPKVYDFNRKVHKLSKGKPLNIYIGYDSTHNNIEEVTKFSIEQSIKKFRSHGQATNHFMPEIKYLDYSKIPEYNREYKNQSTAFTYSRFLIPYLENYEGFSMFIDDDILFEKSLLPMFYYLNPDDAVACIQYPQYEHDSTKFNGEINIDYPCKLWSSLMIFNNGHEDCKKLTPEVVNTWTGAQLHQFEWTDKISKIPEHYIFTEGYDNPETKWDCSGYHYTRGGPWIDNMDTSSIKRLSHYEKIKLDMDNLNNLNRG